MTFGTERSKSSTGYDHRRLPPNALGQRALGGATLVSVAALCAWVLCANFPGTGADQIGVANIRGDKLDLAGTRADKLAVVKPRSPASNVYASLFDPRFSLGASPGSFANIAPLRHDSNSPGASPLYSLATSQTTPDTPATLSRDGQVAPNAILPIPRPATAPARNASVADSAHGSQTTDAPPPRPSIFAAVFEKLFG